MSSELFLGKYISESSMLKCKIERGDLICANHSIVADPDDPLKTTDQTRRLGLIVCYCSPILVFCDFITSS